MTATPDATIQPAAPLVSADTLVDMHNIVDALYRFAAGQDRRLPELFESAFAADAVVDFTQPAARFGVVLPAFVGRKPIADTILGTTAALITTHTVTNPRVSVAGDRAYMTALVEAQHVLRRDPSRYLLLKNHYTVSLSRSGPTWLIDHMLIENAWHSGEPEVLFPAVGTS
jgi:ketosteroid isomerase-like protein